MGAIVEYFGEGVTAMSCTGKEYNRQHGCRNWCNYFTFRYDESMSRYLSGTGRADVAALADTIKPYLNADPECYENPEKYFDQVIEINLSELEPHLNGPSHGWLHLFLK
ncbi:MAG: aconitase family protein [Chitinophagales bacterium]